MSAQQESRAWKQWLLISAQHHIQPQSARNAPVRFERGIVWVPHVIALPGVPAAHRQHSRLLLRFSPCRACRQAWARHPGVQHAVCFPSGDWTGCNPAKSQVGIIIHKHVCIHVYIHVRGIHTYIYIHVCVYTYIADVHMCTFMCHVLRAAACCTRVYAALTSP